MISEAIQDNYEHVLTRKFMQGKYSKAEIDLIDNEDRLKKSQDF